MSTDRDPREPDDPRDERDERRGDDPRDERDPRLPTDPIEAAYVVREDAAEAANTKTHFVRWLTSVIVVGLVAVSFTAWQVRTLRLDGERRTCEGIVEARGDLRSVFLHLVARNPDRADDPDIVAFLAYLDERLPQLECSGDRRPTVVRQSSDQDDH